MTPKLRHLILVVAAGALYYSGLLRLRSFFRRAILGRNEICILGLHRVLSEDEAARTHSLDGMVMKEATFTRMLQFLNRNFRVVSIQTFLEGTPSDDDDSRPRCLLTFDDGWRDNYTTAFPLLRRFQLPATIFLVTGLIGTPEVFWVERLRAAWMNPSRRSVLESMIAEVLPGQRGSPETGLEEFIEYAKHRPADDRARLLERLLPPDRPSENSNGVDQMMSWSEAAELSRNGVELGAHTVTHPLLTYETPATVRAELKRSKETLEEKLAAPARAFAYPNGDFNDAVRREVERAGFRCAFTTRRAWFRRGGDLFAAPRIMIHEKRVTGLNGEFSPAAFSLTLARWQ
ncbi:MAG: polysaccharide deacetylase family protein [Terriglobia bacterium]